MKEFWDNRYSSTIYIYGEDPNIYLTEKLDTVNTGNALFVAEGEGRNAVYAAELGWKVSAFDQSSQAKEKALQLAKRKSVNITYTVNSIESIDYETESFDLIAFIYAHFPAEKRRRYHRKVAGYLKKDGLLLLQGFAQSHVDNQAKNHTAGGPKDHHMLFDIDDLKTDFEDFDFIEALETEYYLAEGELHNGKANVVRVFARKK